MVKEEEEAELEDLEVPEGLVEELHPLSLVRSCCRTGRGRRLEEEPSHSCSRRWWLHRRRAR